MSSPEKEETSPISAGCGGGCSGCGGCGRCRGAAAPEYVVISSFVWPPWPEKQEENRDPEGS